ncbi:hypothetical protein BCR34DRAFT_554153 [Clohesyomyces aquaticus]|uniref:Zn(2)-C6 fungal-type domain-containing protein n=1 Tax=Clohesyomyces aquaticus TaxID=1231657 RepID=A0A1Y2A7V2_9PLEO|nr:hypothetical protein BCR34DRAFT_554153 [Clohesyomyces aquaticus]
MAETTTPIRQSCDRCRGQKLRCERDEERDTGACTRCIRLGSQCVYSHSLPKGRPNPYSRSGSGGRSGSRSEQNGYGTDNANRGPTAMKRAGTPITRESVKEASRGDTTANTAFSNAVDTMTSRPQNWGGISGIAAGMEDVGFMDALTSSAGPMPLAAQGLPWLGAWSWNDSCLDDLNALGGGCVFPAQTTAFDEQAAAPPTWSTCSTRGKTGAENASQRGVGLFLEPSFFVETDTLGGKRNDSGINDLTPASDTRGPSSALAQLTQLSLRLHSLHSSSQALAENVSSPSTPFPTGDANFKTRQVPAVDKVVFQTLITRLLQDTGDESPRSGSGSGSGSPQPSSLGGILQEALCATRQLLDTIAISRQQQRNTTSNSPLTPVPTPTSSESSKTGSQQSSPVIRLLITSCHGMLVSIYTAIFTVLQRDVDWLSPARCGELGLENGPLSDMRLVVIVQLCAYLVYRQQQAVDSYVSLNLGAEAASAERNAASNELEGEMRLGLDRLRLALNIR